MGIIRTILVPVEDSHMPSSLETAFHLARALGSHVIGLHVQDDPTAMMPLIGEGMSSGMIEEMMAAAERQGTARSADAHALFEHLRQKHDVALQDAPPPIGPEGDGLRNQATAQWLIMTGREDDLMACRSRLVDLVVMSRSTMAADASFQMILNAILMESGKPLLLAPPVATATVGKHIAIAWNGSAEAARAVSSALPLLVAAEKVTILTVPETAQGAGHTKAEELARYLAWHGVAAAGETLGSGGNAGTVLLSACQTIGADLLVMGAYTHSRLRQLILGGVTQHVLAHAEIACLLRH